MFFLRISSFRQATPKMTIYFIEYVRAPNISLFVCNTYCCFAKFLLHLCFVVPFKLPRYFFLVQINPYSFLVCPSLCLRVPAFEWDQEIVIRPDCITELLYPGLFHTRFSAEHFTHDTQNNASAFFWTLPSHGGYVHVGIATAGIFIL